MSQVQLENLYSKYRRLLFSLAYRLVGSVTDAEDLVHDVFVQLNEKKEILEKNPRSLLCTMITHRCIDFLRSARKKRESYIGPWLPEPLVIDPSDPLEEVVQDDYLSMAMMIVLEQLTITERVVFILREVFQFDYTNISQIIGKEESNCRKIFSRAKTKIVKSNKTNISLTKTEEQTIIQTFLTALHAGEIEKAITLLSPDITYISDGGGKVTAALKPISGVESVKKLFIGLSQRFAGMNISIQPTLINGKLGILFLLNNQLQSAMSFHITDGCIKEMYNILNPDKLAHINISNEHEKTGD